MRRSSDRSDAPHPVPAARPADAAPPPIRVFIVDDDGHARLGIRMRLRLEPDIDVVGESAECAEAVDAAMAARPDVIVIDLQCADIDGIAATRRLRELAPGCAVVMISMYDGECVRAAAASAGVSAFVAKHQVDCALLDEIRGAARP